MLVATVETNKRFEVTLCSLDPEFYGQLKQMGQEGVVAKRLTAPYRKGRSADWLKFKICRDVSVVAVGYDYGEGKRAEIGAVHMAMLDEDGAQAVFVGKVGSGFTDEEIAKVKSEIDAQRLPVLEVTTMGLTRGDVLREPRFKGFRTDLVLHEVTVAQLSALPKG